MSSCAAWYTHASIYLRAAIIIYRKGYNCIMFRDHLLLAMIAETRTGDFVLYVFS